jgi:DNA repair exonuclease SbcCD ATPase subunit
MIPSDPTYDPEGNDLANKIIQEDSSFAKLKSLVNGMTYAQNIRVAQIACNQMAGSPPNQIIQLKPIGGKFDDQLKVDTLSEGYKALKQELDALLKQVDAETRLAETALTLQLEIDEKTRRLTELKQDIEQATEHYANFKILLENLGIDPRKKQLTFDKHLLLSAGSVSDVAATMPDPIDYKF